MENTGGLVSIGLWFVTSSKIQLCHQKPMIANSRIDGNRNNESIQFNDDP
jgi:hypothetical protein